jgi:hypothetical protein
MNFVLIFHSESTQIENLPITRRTSPEEEERIQQATWWRSPRLKPQLDNPWWRKNPRSNLYLITRQRRFPRGMIHGGAHDSFRLNNSTPLNPRRLASLYRRPENYWAWTGPKPTHTKS